MKLKRTNKLSEWRRINSLYKKAFPKYERKPFTLIRTMHKRGVADVWILDNNGEFAGLAITMNAKDLVLLDYFAIDDKKRGRGLGSDALKVLNEYYKDKRLFLEIESVYTDAENISERKRRKQFYLRNGMKEMRVMASVFGVEMELLGFDKLVSFEEYHSIYLSNLGKWAADNIKEKPYPQ